MLPSTVNGQQPMDRPTIVLAEDHPNVAEQLRRLLSTAFDVVAVVGHGEALVKSALKLRPDIVVTDVSMPGMDGIRAAHELAQQLPSLGIVFVTVHDDPALARKALAVGRGYVLKASAGEELIDAVFAALDSRRFVSPSLGSLEEVLEGDGRPPAKI
jgi:DNA-binding NarL/FixJ family response regulator